MCRGKSGLVTRRMGIGTPLSPHLPLPSRLFAATSASHHPFHGPSTSGIPRHALLPLRNDSEGLVNAICKLTNEQVYWVCETFCGVVFHPTLFSSLYFFLPKFWLCFFASVIRASPFQSLLALHLAAVRLPSSLQRVVASSRHQDDEEGLRGPFRDNAQDAPPAERVHHKRSARSSGESLLENRMRRTHEGRHANTVLNPAADLPVRTALAHGHAVADRAASRIRGSIPRISGLRVQRRAFVQRQEAVPDAAPRDKRRRPHRRCRCASLQGDLAVEDELRRAVHRAVRTPLACPHPEAVQGVQRQLRRDGGSGVHARDERSVPRIADRLDDTVGSVLGEEDSDISARRQKERHRPLLPDERLGHVQRNHGGVSSCTSHRCLSCYPKMSFLVSSLIQSLFLSFFPSFFSLISLISLFLSIALSFFFVHFLFMSRCFVQEYFKRFKKSMYTEAVGKTSGALQLFVKAKLSNVSGHYKKMETDDLAGSIGDALKLSDFGA